MGVNGILEELTYSKKKFNLSNILSSKIIDMIVLISFILNALAKVDKRERLASLKRSNNRL